ncbi:Cactin, central domain containing protein [Trema orientale]|uniref:Cactin, central domain containing protein n=1 Tax=Trema orientale TaxID=63057 RepID=A0A2P5FVE5_TREOI|nr:Cactin, central domain containing protein [Trema orientale]
MRGKELEAKTYGELEALQSRVESPIDSGTANVVKYWEALVKRLHTYKAKDVALTLANEETIQVRKSGCSRGLSLKSIQVDNAYKRACVSSIVILS